MGNMIELKDVKTFGNISQECIEKYAGIVPDELIAIWENYGICSFHNGYLRTINPDDYDSILKSSYFLGEKSIPILVTAFGDIITWEAGRCIRSVNYRYHNYETMITGFKLFLRLLSDTTFTSRFFAMQAFAEAVERYGELAWDECFGYVPLLALGGPENVDHLKKVKTKEHISLITQFVGPI